VHEQEDHYEIDIDLPGFAKEDISLQLEEGYLTVSATKAVEENKESKGKLIRQERFSGSMQRSFYVGENVTDGEIKARFEDGVLQLTIPRKDAKKIPEKQHILIEG
jgi:HSP20 family molecular chaperone IbpA